ncbi:ribosome silencing factor [Hydrogenobaculum acidophilum]
MDKLRLIKTLLEDKKAEDISILDVRKHTNIADYFVIATANSSIHAKALAEYLEKELKNRGITIDHVEGLNEHAQWILLDLLDVIVHIQTKEAREYYNLDWLWSNAERVDI